MEEKPPQNVKKQRTKAEGYACTVNSDASVVYGDSSNPNDVTLTWKRTNTEYHDKLFVLGELCGN